MKKSKTNSDINKELISKDLTELIKPLLTFVILAILFGYAGYKYSIDNGQDIRHGIIFLTKNMKCMMVIAKIVSMMCI